MRFIAQHKPQPAIIVGALVLAVTLVVADLAGWPSATEAPTRTDLLVIVSSLCILCLVAALLASPRSPRARSRLGNYRTQEIFRLVARRLAPPAVAGALALSHTPAPTEALAVSGAMLVATFAMGGARYPLHLAGVARVVFDLVMPAVGMGIALTVAALGQVDLGLASTVVPLLGAWLVTFAGGGLEEAFNSGRPIRMAVVGDPRLASAFALEMESSGVRDHKVVGWIGNRPNRRIKSGVPLLGELAHIGEVVRQAEINLLVMPTRSDPDFDAFHETVESCVDLPVRMMEASRLYEEMHGRVPIGQINAAWFAYIMHPRFSPQAEWSKRLMDVAISTALFLLLLPLFATVAALVKLADRGPVFFSQRRVGARGREFDVLKFRTMRVGAEEPGKAQWAQEADPRVTRVGRFLRASHLDEMPQLLNVVGGSMSLVGPRPERPEFVADLEQKVPYYNRRVLVRPGLTGWAQVRAGYAVDREFGTAFKVSHDLYYIKHRSMVFDLLTLVETARTLVADAQYGRKFTYSEAFLLGPRELSQEAALQRERRAVLAGAASLPEDSDRLRAMGHEPPSENGEAAFLSA